MSLITITLAGGGTAEVEDNPARVVHAVDAQGQYLGLVDAETAPSVVPGPPPDADARWDSQAGQWVRAVPLHVAVAAALDEIDRAAGAARLRYITDVPGQQATYLLKQQQAQAFLEAPSDPPPPFVAAEAEAMGVPPADAAAYIVQTAALWEQLAPVIERERRRGKVAAAAAADHLSLSQTVAATLAVLQAI